jgi:OPA family glycerol-3-phosphate transporter-like MFS transporter
MSLSIVFICLAAVIGIYFYNNPLRHGPWFLSRRFINWFPLGMTYSFLYMGRYNLTVAKNALGSLMNGRPVKAGARGRAPQSSATNSVSLYLS